MTHVRAEWRERERRFIDPATAIVSWRYAQPVDPLCLLTGVCLQTGPIYLARRPGAQLYVEVRTRPSETRDRIRGRIARGAGGYEPEATFERAFWWE